MLQNHGLTKTVNLRRLVEEIRANVAWIERFEAYLDEVNLGGFVGSGSIGEVDLKD